jgi:hypothetical protein
LVSILEFSEAGGVMVDDSGATFVSALLDMSGVGLAEVPPAPGAALALGAAVVSVLVDGGGVVTAGVFTVFVAPVVSVSEVSLLRLQPPSERASVVRRTSKDEGDSFMECNLVGFPKDAGDGE